MVLLTDKARKLEGEIDVKLAAFAKLCAGYDSNFSKKHDSGIGQDQVSLHSTCV